ncbi:MAG: UDP-glucose 4-epimerase [Gaiellaceae bacterium]|nr:UDP-glucose 4-epimerase [Gaiellaceae bacterium]
MTQRVGITGAAGFIGSHLCARLLSEGHDVVGVDDFSFGSLANLESCLDNSRFRLETFDCSRRRDLRRVFDGCDTIFHLAAMKIPRYGGTVRTLESNVSGAAAAAAVALAIDADLIIASTSDVYGNAPAPFMEDGPIVLGPPTTRRWAYATSKLYDEHVVLALAEERGLRVSILRLFNVYGPNNHLSWWGGPVVTFYEALLRGQMIDIHGDGRQVRTFTYVEDTVDAFVRSLDAPEARGEVINVGASSPVTILELAGLVQETLGIPQPLRARFIPYESFPGRYQDVRHRVPDVSKAQGLLGFTAQVSLEDGLRRSLDWHRMMLEREEAAEA